MKNYKQYITPAILAIGLAAWMGRSEIRNLFPPKMKFANTALTTVDDQRKITVSDLKGSVVIVSCFQTWCVDCARETPAISELAATIQSPAFKVIYISDEPVEKISAFRDRFSKGNIVFTHTASSMKELGISVFPSTFLLDKKGAVVKTKLEGYNWLDDAEMIKKLINE